MYYSLTNFYQNHRRYVKSRDDNQLLGTSLSFSALSPDCEPYRGVANGSFPGGGTSFAPCGAIANSLFNGRVCSGDSMFVGLDVVHHRLISWTL